MFLLVKGQGQTPRLFGNSRQVDPLGQVRRNPPTEGVKGRCFLQALAAHQPPALFLGPSSLFVFFQLPSRFETGPNPSLTHTPNAPNSTVVNARSLVALRRVKPPPPPPGIRPWLPSLPTARPAAAHRRYARPGSDPSRRGLFLKIPSRESARHCRQLTSAPRWTRHMGVTLWADWTKFHGAMAGKQEQNVRHATEQLGGKKKDHPSWDILTTRGQLVLEWPGVQRGLLKNVINT